MPKLTYAQLKDAIQLAALNDPNGVIAGSQEDKTYSSMINQIGIGSWEDERDILWNELWVDMPNAATLALTTTAIDLEDDFRFIGEGYVRLTYPNGSISVLKVKKLEEIALNPYHRFREFYVSGNPTDGFQLLLGWTPTAQDVGATVSYRYYRFATQLSQPTDVPDMSNPMYIVYKVAATVAANNYNTNLYQINEDRAADALTNMRVANMAPSNYQDNYVKDMDYLTGRRSSVPNRMSHGYWQGQ